MRCKDKILLNVTLYAGLRKQKTSTFSAEMSKGCQIKDLLQELEIAQHDIEIIVVNGNISQMDTELKDQDRITFIPFVSGG